MRRGQGPVRQPQARQAHAGEAAQAPAGQAAQAQTKQAAQARAGHRQAQGGQVQVGLRQAQVRQLQVGLPQSQVGWHVDAGRVEPRSHGHAPVLLVPVPSARSTVRARGHDPARRIALAAAGELRRTGTPARVVAVLRQRRWVADQSGLNSRERMGNLAGALEVVEGGARLLVGGPVVLVDDLMTTGASLREAARAVREAITGGGEVGATAAVYARVSREGREEHNGRSNGRPLENGRDMALSAPGIVSVNGPADLICAAVIAASPDSFEINRN
ncbi:ComF family protein [Streptomyces sp. NBC_00988]|uniref:ComF family protein n=1 Tax=Streptomyces sp. NBC_00988 TaxID=2903704 RepID=UPI00386B6C7D